MPPRSRRLVIVCAALLPLLSGCRPARHTSVFIDPALLTLVPNDSVFMGGIKFDKLQDTALFKKFVAGAKDGWLVRFGSETGIDPARDLYEVLAASDGRSSVQFWRGRFGGQFGREPHIHVDGGTSFQYKGREITGRDDYAIFFMNSSVAVTGSRASLQNLIDNQDGTRAGPSQALLALTRKIPYERQFWAVGLGAGSMSAAIPKEGNLANLRRLLASVNEVVFSAEAADGLQLSLNASYGTPQAAKENYDAAKGLLAIAHLQFGKKEPELEATLDAAGVRLNGPTVEVSASLSMAALEKLQQMIRSRTP